MDKIAKHLENIGAAEHVISIFKAAASSNPYTGALASLISDYIPNQRQIKLEEFAKNVSEDLERFKEELNDDYIKTEEFVFIFGKCFKGAMDNYQIEKINAFNAPYASVVRHFSESYGKTGLH